MATKRDYYELLGIDRTASSDDIRSAYRKLARTLHPDVNKNKDASKKFSEVQEAYDVLSDDEKRKAYDRFGHAGVGAGASGAGGAGPGYGPGGAQWSYSTGGHGGATDEDIGSIFEQMFSSGSPFGSASSGRARGQRAQPRPRRGRDLAHSLTVAFDTAASGGTQQLRLSSSGSVQTIDVKIPSGIESGAKLRVRGKGAPAPTAGGKAGDLILTIDVAPHPYFRRDGLNIFIDVPLTIVEATLGVTVSVPLITGSVDLKIPPGTSSGQKLRITGKGIIDSKGRTGDQYAVIQIIAPKELTKRASDLLNDLAKDLKNPRDSGPWESNQQ